MSPRSTYIRTPNFDFKPGTGPIALGNLIADPMSPHHPLITVRNEKKTDHQFKAEANGDIKMAKIGMEGGGKWKSGG